MSILKTSNIQDTSGNNNSTPEQINQGRAKAFVNWGTISNVVTIRDSLNVASVTETSVGNHSITFTNAFPNTNYVVVLGSNGSEFYFNNLGKATTGFSTGIANSSGANLDASQQSVVVFSN